MAKKEYPGDLDDYEAAKQRREEAEAAGSDPAVVAALSIAEQLAGLAYLVDGIRYNTRKQS